MLFFKKKPHKKLNKENEIPSFIILYDVLLFILYLYTFDCNFTGYQSKVWSLITKKLLYSMHT